MDIRARVLIGDDHVLVAEAIKQLLESEFNVVGIATDGRVLVQVALRLRPDVVIIDLAMPKLNGLDAGRRILQSVPSAKIIHLTMNTDRAVEQKGLSHGASAFLSKTVSHQTLIDAIKAALNQPKSYPTAGSDQPRTLTNRQRDVLQLLAEGLSMKQVAFVLNLATRTVAFHKYRIMNSFGLTSDAELVQFAVRNHLVFVDGGREPASLTEKNKQPAHTAETNVTSIEEPAKKAFRARTSRRCA